jgi:hypothetical protein
MMMTAMETTSEKYYNKAIRQLLQYPMIIVCLVQMLNGFMDDFRAVRGCNSDCNSSYDSDNSFRICTLER